MALLSMCDIGIIFMITQFGYIIRINASARQFYRDKVLTIDTPGYEQWEIIQNITKYHLKDVDIWRLPHSHSPSMDVYVPDNHYKDLSKDLDLNGITYNVIIDDLSSVIDNSHIKSENINPHMNNVTRHKRATRHNTFDKIIGIYPRYEQILEWMHKAEKMFPDIVRIIDIGNSYEGRPMKVMKLGTHRHHKWSIWLDGGMHSREWIAHTSALYIAHQLITDYISDLPWSLLDQLDFYILPVLNPDGYEYCHTTNRIWRKSRRNVTDQCYGVDLNRNWNFKWGEEDASPDPCSLVYRGEHPESEPEVRNIVKFLLPRAPAFVAYLSLHSYSQHVYSRWDYSASETPADNKELLHVAYKMAQRMEEAYGWRYEAGKAPLLSYPFSGSSADWARGVAKIKYSYIIELRDRGQHQFILPPDQIVPTGEEALAAMKYVSEHVIKEHNSKRAPYIDIPKPVQIVVKQTERTENSGVTYSVINKQAATQKQDMKNSEMNYGFIMKYNIILTVLLLIVCFCIR